MNRDIQNLREDYKFGHLLEGDLPRDPIQLFHHWFREAQDSNILEPNAMTLATVDANGRPSARIVLLKEIHQEGFVFYTNYSSRKGIDISGNAHVSLVFLWKEIERQVRIEGKAIKLSEEASTEYYHSRPKGSQIGAWVSPQSQSISDRSVLEDEYEKLSDQYAGVDQLPKPPNWGGYVIIPDMIEYWQGRTSRLHDRIRYKGTKDGWTIDRLAP